jgi:hypothetical protein
MAKGVSFFTSLFPNPVRENPHLAVAGVKIMEMYL